MEDFILGERVYVGFWSAMFSEEQDRAWLGLASEQQIPPDKRGYRGFYGEILHIPTRSEAPVLVIQAPQIPGLNFKFLPGTKRYLDPLLAKQYLELSVCLHEIKMRI